MASNTGVASFYVHNNRTFKHYLASKCKWGKEPNQESNPFPSLLTKWPVKNVESKTEKNTCISTNKKQQQKKTLSHAGCRWAANMSDSIRSGVPSRWSTWQGAGRWGPNLHPTLLPFTARRRHKSTLEQE